MKALLPEAFLRTLAVPGYLPSLPRFAPRFAHRNHGETPQDLQYLLLGGDCHRWGYAVSWLLPQ